MISLRDEIVKNIAAALSGVKVSAGYNLDFKQVKTGDIKIPSEIPGDKFPAIYVLDTKEDISIADIGALDKSLSVVVIAFFKATANDDKNIVRRKITADIEKAVCVDAQRGGYALMTYPTSIVTDEGMLGTYGEVDYTFVVKYRQLFGQPNVQE